MLSIEADPEWVKAKLSEVKRLALPGNGLVDTIAELPAEIESDSSDVEYTEYEDIEDEDR